MWSLKKAFFVWSLVRGDPPLVWQKTTLFTTFFSAPFLFIFHITHGRNLCRDTLWLDTGGLLLLAETCQMLRWTMHQILAEICIFTIFFAPNDFCESVGIFIELHSKYPKLCQIKIQFQLLHTFNKMTKGRRCIVQYTYIYIYIYTFIVASVGTRQGSLTKIKNNRRICILPYP